MTKAEDREFQDSIRREVQRVSEEMRRDIGRVAGAEESRAKTEFLRNMTHELRTPLSAVIAFTSVLIDRLDGQIGDADMECLQAAHKGGLDVLEIVSQILEMSRLLAHEYQITPAPTPVADIIDSCLDARQQQLRGAGMRVVREIHPDVPDVLADRTALIRCVLILVDNAVKFSPHGSDIMITADRGEDGIEIVVADRGIGIPPEMIDRVTTPFFQADGGLRRQHGGIGLGLSIARALLELQGGKLKIFSLVGLGTSVHLVVPASDGVSLGA